MTDRTEDELIELFEERAAIMEHCGGMSRRDAEQAAYWDWRRQVGNVPVPAVGIRKRKKMEGRNGKAPGDSRVD